MSVSIAILAVVDHGVTLLDAPVCVLALFNVTAVALLVNDEVYSTCHPDA